MTVITVSTVTTTAKNGDDDVSETICSTHVTVITIILFDSSNSPATQ